MAEGRLPEAVAVAVMTWGPDRWETSKVAVQAPLTALTVAVRCAAPDPIATATDASVSPMTVPFTTSEPATSELAAGEVITGRPVVSGTPISMTKVWAWLGLPAGSVKELAGMVIV